MDLKDIKKLVSYARRAGVKVIRVNDVSVEFHDAVIFPKRSRPKLVASGHEIPAPPPEPTLEQINQFIYQQDDAG